MNKKTALYVIFTINSLLVFPNQDSVYTIIGILPDSINNTYIYMTQIWPADSLIIKHEINNSDSALVRNGTFRFNGKVNPSEKHVYKLWSNTYRNISGMLILESGCINIRLGNDTIIGGQIMLSATGTPLNNQLTDSILSPSYEIAKQLSSILSINFLEITTEQKELLYRNRALAKIMYFNLVSFIKENCKNAAGEYVFLLYGKAIQDDELSKILPLLSEEMQQKYNESKKSIELVGHRYIPIEGKTPDNKHFQLSDIIGENKLILLDFWASWCGPCIKEMPMLRALYEHYKDKGLEIIGISIDNDESLWKQAIAKHDMVWLQIITDKSVGKNAAELYGVGYIPYTVLIDNTGKIIDTNLRQERLSERIIELLK